MSIGVFRAATTLSLVGLKCTIPLSFLYTCVHKWEAGGSLAFLAASAAASTAARTALSACLASASDIRLCCRAGECHNPITHMIGENWGSVEFIVRGRPVCSHVIAVEFRKGKRLAGLYCKTLLAGLLLAITRIACGAVQLLSRHTDLSNAQLHPRSSSPLLSLPQDRKRPHDPPIPTRLVAPAAGTPLPSGTTFLSTATTPPSQPPTRKNGFFLTPSFFSSPSPPHPPPTPRVKGPHLHHACLYLHNRIPFPTSIITCLTFTVIVRCLHLFGGLSAPLPTAPPSWEPHRSARPHRSLLPTSPPSSLLESYRLGPSRSSLPPPPPAGGRSCLDPTWSDRGSGTCPSPGRWDPGGNGMECNDGTAR